MIVTREETSRAHLATGVWGRVTLDQILEKNAATKPDKLAVADFADRSEWTTGRAQQLTYRELDQRVETLAAFFAGLGLTPDSVIGMQMPPMADAVVVFFAAIRAGLIVAPMPLAWREAEVIEALTQVGAKAIATVAETIDEAHGERLRDVAAEMFHIRFVFAAGGKVPDGVIDLDRVFDETEGLGSAPNIIRKGNAADHAASIAWSVPADGGTAVPLARAHNHWIATGLMTLLEAKIDQSAVILSPFAVTSLAALGGALMPWLLACGTLVLGLPRSVDRFAETAADFKATHILTPQRFAKRLSERLDMLRQEPMLLVVGGDRPVDTNMPRSHDIVDLTQLGELALIARRRPEPEAPSPLPVGAVGAPSETDFAPLLFEARVKAVALSAREASKRSATVGEVQLRGAMVPDHAFSPTGRAVALSAEEQWISTGTACELVSAHPARYALKGPIGDRIGVGGLGIDLKRLDDLYKSIDGVADAAAVPFPDATSLRVAALVVPEPGRSFSREAFVAAVRDKRVGLHKLPVDVFIVPSIARSGNDRVLRAGMASRLAGQQAATEPPPAA
ncbi:MAG: class I adenylate-forming enzyme family protein [Ancalomicrobiaceae bacterium]|nr:class I adenylate-forming enzyme family protein [Ancalomicrobiaceae bacterium]